MFEWSSLYWHQYDWHHLIPSSSINQSVSYRKLIRQTWCTQAIMVSLNSESIFKSKAAYLYWRFSAQMWYRFAPKIALLLLILIFFWTSFHIANSGYSRASECHCQSKSKSHFQLNQTNQADQRRILIISNARSGSSFLGCLDYWVCCFTIQCFDYPGDLLQQASSTYYSFEPLISTEFNSDLFDQLIFRIFQCQFEKLQDSYLKPIYWKIQYLKWNSLLVRNIDSQDSMQLFNHTVHQMLCTNVAAILVKTIRFTLHDYWRTIGLYGKDTVAI